MMPLSDCSFIFSRTILPTFRQSRTINRHSYLRRLVFPADKLPGAYLPLLFCPVKKILLLSSINLIITLETFHIPCAAGDYIML